MSSLNDGRQAPPQPGIRQQSANQIQRYNNLGEAAAFFSEPIASLAQEAHSCGGCRIVETSLGLFSSAIVVRKSSTCGICSDPAASTYAYPKSRVRDVSFVTQPVCCGLKCFDFACNWMGLSFLKCSECTQAQKKVIFELTNTRSSKKCCGNKPRSEFVTVDVGRNVREDVMIHYVYGVLAKTVDKTHVLAHLHAGGLSQPAQVSLDMDRL